MAEHPPHGTGATSIPTQEEIDERLSRYAASLDASVLWPGIPARAFRAAQEAIAVTTAAVLAGAPSPIRLASPPGVDARTLGVAAFTSGLGPLLGFWCETGRIDAEPALHDLLAMHLDHGRRRTARLREELDRLALACASRSIEITVLKGMHTAFAYFPDPGTRPMADMDLLVRWEDLDRVRATLIERGYEAHTRDPRLRGGHWWPPGVSRRPRSLDYSHVEDPWSLDLHVTLDIEFFPGLETGFGRPQPSQLVRCEALPETVRALAEPLLLGYLAFHASSHFFTIPLVRLVELVLVSRRDFDRRASDWSAFYALVRRNLGRFVHPSLELAERLAPGTLDPAVRKRLAAETPRRLRRIVARTTPGSAQRIYSQPFGERYLWIASLRELAAALLQLVWPWDRTGPASLRDVAKIQTERVVRVSRGIARRLSRPVGRQG